MNGNSYMGMEGMYVHGTCLYQGLAVILQLLSVMDAKIRTNLDAYT